ncbi:hypothetical protein [Paenibacillus sp. WC2504]|uniref:hypothetical protein n=1 Tax=Paenibacillus sp. WC2504 TaxID=3461403 RepID=UPI004045D147
MEDRWIIASGIIISVAATVIYSAVRKRNKPMLLNDLIDSYSEACDEIILQELGKGGLRYVSGRLTIALAEQDKQILVNSEYYFQNDQNEWVRKTNNEQFNVSYLTSQSLDELRTKGELIFEIAMPAEASPVTA